MRINWENQFHASSPDLCDHINLNARGEFLNLLVASLLADAWWWISQQRLAAQSIMQICVINMRVRREGVSWCMDFFVHWWPPRDARTSSTSPVGRPLFPTCLLCCLKKRSALHCAGYYHILMKLRLTVRWPLKNVNRARWCHYSGSLNCVAQYFSFQHLYEVRFH